MRGCFPCVVAGDLPVTCARCALHMLVTRLLRAANLSELIVILSAFYYDTDEYDPVFLTMLKF